MSLGSHGCQFVPPYLLRQLADSRELGTPVTEEAARAAGQTLATDAGFRAARADAAAQPTTHAAGPIAWTVHTAGNGTTLPGALVRSAGDPDSGDAAVDEAAYGGQGALDLFREVYGRDSFDGAGAAVTMTVHYGRNYDNAFWNGAQLVFGDGDGRIFDRFTKPVDVLGHELTHAVTEHTAGLVYQDQPGALNESMSDVFASCLKQRLLGQTADQADWLIGPGPLPARRPRPGAARHGRARHGVRRPAARPRPAGGRTCATTSTPPTTTAGCTSTAASPTRRSTSRPPPSAARPGRGRAASGTPR